MEETFSKEESLHLISQMINAAKKEQKDNGIGWIMWGWLLFIVSILTVFNIRFRWFEIGFFWNVFGIVVLVYMFFEIIRSQFFKKVERVRTYTQDLFSKLNAGFFISLMFIIFSMNMNVENNPAVYHSKGFALLINLYGFWILIYGTALNFKPSVIASFVVWAIGFVCMVVQTFEAVMLLHAAAVLFGYIIPGHIANSQFKKLHQKGNSTHGV
jgi:hypothetical protein